MQRAERVPDADGYPHARLALPTLARHHRRVPRGDVRSVSLDLVEVLLHDLARMLLAVRRAVDDDLHALVGELVDLVVHITPCGLTCPAPPQEALRGTGHACWRV